MGSFFTRLFDGHSQARLSLTCSSFALCDVWCACCDLFWKIELVAAKEIYSRRER